MGVFAVSHAISSVVRVLHFFKCINGLIIVIKDLILLVVWIYKLEEKNRCLL